MSFRFPITLLLILGLLASCGPLTPFPTVESPTVTSSPIPTRTASPIPMYTFTPSITPLPTIPTFTPTFVVSKIVTVTPAEAAVCPTVNTGLEPNFPGCDSNGCLGWPYSKDILEYLKSGGSIEKLERHGSIQDLTGDGVKELAYQGESFFVYGCRGDTYETLLEMEGTQNYPRLNQIVDLNANGIPEIIVSNHERRAFHSIRIFEWQGSEFTSLIEVKFINFTYNPLGETITYDWLGGTVLDYEIIDVHKDGLREIRAIDRIPVSPDDLSSGLPWRDRTIILGWNGARFVIIHEEYTPPQYRFQAIQDADRLVTEKEYEKALTLYQDAIFSDNLDWWSKDRKTYESKTTLDMWFQNAMKLMIETATPFPTLPAVTPDQTEYPRLAAYAYYRIMLLHIIRSYDSDADTVYKNLQQKFPEGNPGHPYLEMATAFWNEYQSSQNMTNACGAAIEYAAEHLEILVPLGSDYHGSQSHTYKPEDVCPFR